MNLTLYRAGIRNGWKLFTVFCAVMTLYFVIIVTMYDPKMGRALVLFEKMMPQLMAIVGMSTTDTTLAGFMASYLYGFIMPLFPMIFSIVTANRLIASQVDRGSMAYLLSAPVKRVKIACTQAAVLVTGIVLLVGYVTLVGLIACEAVFPGVLDTPAFLRMNLGALMLQLFIGGICFLFSSLFNETKNSVAFGAGIPALAFILQLVANAGKDWAKYATFFTLFNPKGIVAGHMAAYEGMAVLGGGAVVLFVLSVFIFARKDVPV